MSKTYRATMLFEVAANCSAAQGQLMSVDYRIICEKRPEDVEAGDGHSGADLTYVNVCDAENDPLGLQERYGVDAAVVITLNCHHSATRWVNELAARIARAYSGVVWCDHADNPMYDHRQSVDSFGKLQSFVQLLDSWEEWAASQVTEINDELEAKKRRRQEIRERIAAGEKVEGVLDFGDFQWDEEDLENL